MTGQDQKEEALFLKRMKDLADRADRIGYPVFSDFLDAGKRSLLQNTFRDPQINVQFFGGYKDAERVIAAFYPSFLDVSELLEEVPLSAVYLRVKGAKFLKQKPGHRDFLGALLGLGIRRETLGDILVDDNGAAVICLNSMESFVRENVSGICRAEVEAESMDLSTLENYEPDGKEMVIQVSSERLEAVVGKTFAMSRQDASHLIQGGKVHVNWKEETRPDHKAAEGDLISVRGHGRIRVLEQLGTTRSGRIQLKVMRFGGTR